jgi:hypothetical protein
MWGRGGIIFRTIRFTDPFFSHSVKCPGNQRDLAREKAAKKNAGKGKAADEQEGNKGLTKEQRMAR